MILHLVGSALISVLVVCFLAVVGFVVGASLPVHGQAEPGMEAMLAGLLGTMVGTLVGFAVVALNYAWWDLW